jgi:hypothetical protein
MNENEFTEQQESIESNDSSQQETTTQPSQNNSSKEDNFAAMREKVAKAERERDEYGRYIQEIQQRAQMLEAQERQKYAQVEPDIDPSDEDLLEGKHYKKLVGKYKALEEKLEQSTRSNYATAIEARIKSQYTDFDSVVNAESIKALRDSEPELAESLHSNPDIHSKAVATYKAIKRLGLMPSQEQYPDKEVAQKNAAKPKSLASISPQQGESPLTRANAFANGLTDELKKQLLKEMAEARKGY